MEEEALNRNAEQPSTGWLGEKNGLLAEDGVSASMEVKKAWIEDGGAEIWFKDGENTG